MSRQIKPGNSERGWNDPPMISYGGGGPSSAPRRNHLSKRVAFPQGTSYAPVQYSSNLENYNTPYHAYSNATTTSLIPPEAASAQNVQLLPPSYSAEPPCYSGPVIVPSMLNPSSYLPDIPNEGVSSLPPLQIQPQPLVNNLPTLHMAKDPMSDLLVAAVPDDSELQLPSFSDDEQMFHYCVTRLQRALNDCRGTSEKRVIDEMQKKLNIFSDMWKHKQISYLVQSTMARLATAIHRRKYDAANELHVYLMMEHISEVSKWLVGIKRLVQEIEKVPQQPTSPSVSCSQDNHNFEQLLQQQEDFTKLADDPRMFFQEDVIQAVSSFHPNEIYNHHYQHQNEISQVEEVHQLNGQVTVADSINEMAVLSTSPGSVFDPEKIAQCFDGHGELQMRFIEDEKPVSEKPISESLFSENNVVGESLVSTANEVVAISGENVGDSTLVRDLMIDSGDSNFIGTQNQPINQLVELASVLTTEELYNTAKIPEDIYPEIDSNMSVDLIFELKAKKLGSKLNEVADKLNDVSLANMSEMSEIDSLYPECGSNGSVDDLEDVDSVTEQVEQDPYNSACGSFEIKQLNEDFLRPLQIHQEDEVGDYLCKETLEGPTNF